MNLAEVALRRQKERLDELLREQQQQDALQVLNQGWQSVQPELGKAYVRLHLNAPTLPGLLKNYSPEYLAKFIAQNFDPPASPEEAKIRLLADMVIALVFPDKKFDLSIWLALPQIERAYNVVLRSGGGWSSKSNPDKRKTAVLEWYRRNQARLSHLKETYLEDLALYGDGGGQEKRNFITRLMIKIVKDESSMELSFQKVTALLKSLKKLEQPLRLEDVL